MGLAYLIIRDLLDIRRAECYTKLVEENVCLLGNGRETVYRNRMTEPEETAIPAAPKGMQKLSGKRTGS